MPLFSHSDPHSDQVKVILYFMEDIADLNTRLDLNLVNEPSWVLEIHGLDEVERDHIVLKYDRLRREPNVEWVKGVTPLFDIETGQDITEFHDVSPFFVTLMNDLHYKPNSKNPPPNTTGFQPKEIREWNFKK